MVAATYPKAVPPAVSYTHNNGSRIHFSSSITPTLVQLPLRSPKQIDPPPPPYKSGNAVHLQPIKPTQENTSIDWRRKKKKKINRNSASTTTTSNTTSDVLRLMDGLGLPIPTDMYVSLVKECTLTKDAACAAELHSHIINRSRLRPQLPLLNRLLVMHVSCGCLDSACQLFDEMAHKKDLYSWATMIVGYINSTDYEEAMRLFVKMLNQHNMLEFPAWIIVCLLKACVCTMDMGLGMQVHGCLLKLGISDDLSLSNSLISFYGKFRCLEGADFVFDQMSRRNTTTWTVKIVNSSKENHFHEVVNDFKEMGKAGIKKNGFTVSSVLRACGRMEDDGWCGRQVHAEAIKLGVESNIYMQCGLVDMYGKCGLLRDAMKVFETISDKRNIACWNAMIAGYLQNGFPIEAIKFLYQMKAAGVQPQESLLNEVRIACATNALENWTELMECMYKTAPQI